MNQFLDKIHFTKVCTVIIIGAIYFALHGCATIATLESPTGNIWTYTGPKKAEYFWKKGDEEIHYSGLSTPWWAPFVSVLSGAASSALQKPAESQTNINLKP